jgi:FMN phosphatase YigB (HAD superfamily)
VRAEAAVPADSVRAVCLDWGGTLMDEHGPSELPMAQWPQVRVIPGAQELLAVLSARYPVCVATNASVSRRADVEQALARAGLAQFISHIFCFTDIGARKDTPAFWDVVTRTLACAPGEIAMLGDSLEQDVLGPAAQGVRTVWFNPEGLPVPAGVRSIRRLLEFTEVLGASWSTPAVPGANAA